MMLYYKLRHYTYLGILGIIYIVFIFSGNQLKAQNQFNQKEYEILKEETFINPELAKPKVIQLLREAEQKENSAWITKYAILLVEIANRQIDIQHYHIYLHKTLQHLYQYSSSEEDEVNLWTEQGFYYKNIAFKPDSARIFFEKAQNKAAKIGYFMGKFKATNYLSYLEMDKGNYNEALDLLLGLKNETELKGNPHETWGLYNNIGHIYLSIGLYEEAISIFKKNYTLANKAGLYKEMLLSIVNETESLLGMNRLDEALLLLKKGENIIANISEPYHISYYYNTLAKVYAENQYFEKSLEMIDKISSLKVNIPLSQKNRQMIQKAKVLLHLRDTLAAHQVILGVEKNIQQFDENTLTSSLMLEVSQILMLTYQYQADYPKALKYAQVYQMLYAKSYNEQISKDIYKKETKARLKSQEEKAALQESLLKKEVSLNQRNSYVLGLIVFLLVSTLAFIGFILFQKTKYNQELSKSNILIQQKNDELEAQNEEIKQQAYHLENANQEIQDMNENLEQLVKARTREIVEKNEMLEEYAFINAHKLRAPIARLLGLCNLFLRHESEEGKHKIVTFVQQEAQDLDKVVKAIDDAISNSAPLDRWDLENRKNKF